MKTKQFKYSQDLSFNENSYVKMHHFKNRFSSNVINIKSVSKIELEFQDLVEIWKQLVEIHPQFKNRYVLKECENNIEYERKRDTKINWEKRVIDLSNLPSEERVRVHQKNVLKVFNSTEDLWRVFYLDKHNFRACIHHIISDGFSVKFIIEKQIVIALKNLLNAKNYLPKIEFLQEKTTYLEYVDYFNNHYDAKIKCQQWTQIFSNYQYVQLPVSKVRKLTFDTTRKTLNVRLSGKTNQILLKAFKKLNCSPFIGYFSALIQLLTLGDFPRNALIPITVNGRNLLSKNVNVLNTVGCFAAEFPSFLTLPDLNDLSKDSHQRRINFFHLANTVLQQIRNNVLNFAHLFTHEEGRNFISSQLSLGVSFNYVIFLKTIFFFFGLKLFFKGSK